MKAKYIQPQTIIDICVPESMLAQSMFTRPETDDVGINFGDEGITPGDALVKENDFGCDW